MADVYSVIDGRQHSQVLYVSPTGVGEGRIPSDPANIIDVLTNKLVGFDQTTIYCFPGTYDFADKVFSFNAGRLLIFTYDPNTTGNPVIFTRASGAGQIGSYLFNSHGAHSLVFNGVATEFIVDKWVDGSYNANADVPLFWRGYDDSDLKLQGSITVRASKSTSSNLGVFAATYGNSSISLEFGTNHNGKFTFDGLGSSAADSTASMPIFTTVTGNTHINISNVWDNQNFEFKAHGIGEWLVPFRGRIRSYMNFRLNVAFDKLYRLIETNDYSGRSDIYITHQAYNNDGSVNASGVGGTDYFVKDRLLYLVNARGVVSTILNTDLHVSRDRELGSFVYINHSNCYMFIGGTSSNLKVTATYGSGGVAESALIAITRSIASLHYTSNQLTLDGQGQVAYGIKLSQPAKAFIVGVNVDNVVTTGLSTAQASSLYASQLTSSNAVNGVAVAQASSCVLDNVTIDSCTTGLSVTGASRASKNSVTYTNCTTNESSSAGSVIE